VKSAKDTKKSGRFSHDGVWKMTRVGLIVASVYGVIAVTCSALYLLDRHEYSVPMFIVGYLSYPVHYVVFGLMRRQTLFIERLPFGEIIGLAILVVMTAVLYFAVGMGASALWRAARRK